MHKLISEIVEKSGGYREKEILRNPHTIEKSETWNKFHKVAYVSEIKTGSDGYRDGFAIDLVTRNICGW